MNELWSYAEKKRIKDTILQMENFLYAWLVNFFCMLCKEKCNSTKTVQKEPQKLWEYYSNFICNPDCSSIKISCHLGFQKYS